MIVGGYVLTLYCDNKIDEGSMQQRGEHMGSRKSPCPSQATFTHGESGAKARSEARSAGWMVSLLYRRALCPSCVKAGYVLPKVD